MTCQDNSGIWTSVETGQPITFCLGHPGQTRFKNYPGLDNVQCEIEKYTIREVQRCWHTFFINHAHFCNCILVAANTWKPYPIYMYKIWLYAGLHIAIPIHQLLLQALGLLPLQYDNFMLHLGMVWHKMCALDMHEATPTFLKHILKLAGSHIQHYTSHLPDPWLAICWYIPSYLPAIRKISNVCLGFSYPGHPVIWVSSCDPVCMLIWTLPNDSEKKWSGQIRLLRF